MKTFEICSAATLITRVEATSKEEALKIFNTWDADKKFDNSIPCEIIYYGAPDEIEEV